MHSPQQSLLTRSDTIFGVCEGIGEDFGFNAQILRAALALMGFWNPAAALATYAALGVAVLVSRRLFPNPVADAAQADAGGTVQPVVGAQNDVQEIELAVAA